MTAVATVRFTTAEWNPTGLGGSKPMTNVWGRRAPSNSGGEP